MYSLILCFLCPIYHADYLGSRDTIWGSIDLREGSTKDFAGFVTSVTVHERKEGDHFGRPLRCADCPASMLVAGASLRLGRLRVVGCKLRPAK